MRLKEDTSDWNASSVIRRDAKHGGAVKERPRRSHKDTVRWCRGVVGRNHEYDFVGEHVFGYYSSQHGEAVHIWAWLKYECLLCGKQETVDLSGQL